MSDNIKTALTGNLKVNFFKVIFGVVSIACAVIGYKKTTKNSHKVLFVLAGLAGITDLALEVEKDFKPIEVVDE